MTLVEFLRARADEDELSVLSGDCRCGDGPKRPDCPDRVLAEVEAKRRIVELHQHTQTDSYGERPWHGCQVCHVSSDGVATGGGWSEHDPDGWCLTLRLLAFPHADHLDYDPVWRP